MQRVQFAHCSGLPFGQTFVLQNLTSQSFPAQPTPPLQVLCLNTFDICNSKTGRKTPPSTSIDNRSRTLQSRPSKSAKTSSYYFCIKCPCNFPLECSCRGNRLVALADFSSGNCERAFWFRLRKFQNMPTMLAIEPRALDICSYLHGRQRSLLAPNFAFLIAV